MSEQRPFPNSSDVILNTINEIEINGNVSVLSHNVLTGNSITNYSKNSGVVYGNPTSIIDFDLAGLAEKLYNEFYNSPQTITSFENSIDINNAHMNFKNVFQKFRDCLDKYRVAFADEFAKLPSLTVGIHIYNANYFKTPPSNIVSASASSSASTPSKYVTMTNDKEVKIMIDMLESMKNKTLEVLKNPPPPSLSDLKYNANLTTIDKGNLKNWSQKEIDILEEPQNHETVLYVIGQVFNIIPPDHYKSFLIKKPSTASSLSSISKTKFFEFIKKDPASSIMSISNDGTLYVGVIINGQKSGKGMMRWENGNIIEGIFENDSIKINEDGTFIKNDGTSGTLIITNNTNPDASDAEFDGTPGTFNMITGEFIPTGAGAGAVSSL